jgi:hypothetical protein
VDWLTEIMRRFSVAYLQKESFSTVSIKNPLRVLKVKLLLDKIISVLLTAHQWKKESRYADKEWDDEEIGAFESAIIDFGPELRSVCEQVTTRTLPEVVRFFTLWKTHVYLFRSLCKQLTIYV